MHNNIAAHYQPVVDITTGCLSHFEALARPRYGNGDIAQIIALAEESGAIDQIDFAVMGIAANQLSRNAKIRVACNISGITIANSTPELISIILQQLDVAPRMIFEVTETVETPDLSYLAEYARASGASLALDDVGSGYMTIEAAQHLIRKHRPEFVKLSGSLVEAMQHPDVRREVRGLCDMTSDFGGKVIAEHIDSDAKIDRVREMGIRLMQGFMFGAPAREPIFNVSSLDRLQIFPLLDQTALAEAAWSAGI